MKIERCDGAVFGEEHLQGCQSREGASKKTMKAPREGVGPWFLRSQRK